MKQSTFAETPESVPSAEAAYKATRVQEARRVTGSSASPSEPDAASDSIRAGSLRDLRVCGLLLLVIELVFLAADLRLPEAKRPGVLPLHIFNILNAATFFCLTYVRACRERMPPLVLGGCTLLFATTAVLSILTLNRAPLTMTLTIMVVGAAAMVSWEWYWQAALSLAAIASMAAFASMRPDADPHLGYDWLALLVAAGLAQYASQAGQRYRREIAGRIMALQLSHSQLLAESADREAATVANERVLRQLGESEARLRKIFATSTDAITISRLSDGRYLDFNERFSATGYSRSEALGHTAEDLGLFADREQLRRFLRLIKTEGTVTNLEADIRYKDGAIRPFLLSATVTELNGEPCIISICRDISTIKRTEERLRAEIVERTQAEQKHSQFAAIVDASHDSIINVSTETKILSWNPAAEKAYGYTAQEAIGQNIELFVPPEELADTIAANRKVVETGQSVSWEQHARRRDGTRFVTAVSIFPIYDRSGKVTGVGGIGRDITKLKEVEKELRENEGQLVAAREAALAASQAKSEFLSSMSHEIRTPMNAILGMAQLLDETPLNPDQKKYLEIMSNSGDALLELINGILDLAKIESGRLSLEEAGFDLESVVDAAVETLGVRAHQKGLEMLARVMPDVPRGLVGDRMRLRQVLLNLIGNAVKFTEDGQVLLTVEHDRESTERGHLHFSVADSGIGIPEEKLEEVFSNFTQADSSTTRQYGGSGLGLAIVRRLVALMGGRAWVESETGKGSAFHFTAQFQLQTDAPEEKSPAMKLMLNGLRILVVDDNCTNRLILREMLSNRGAEVDESSDGPNALELVNRARMSGAPYKVMLLDCRMPEMDGFEVAERVRNEAGHGLTVLMLTSDDLQVQISRTHELGVDAYLVKPVRRIDLFEAIATAMANHAALLADGVEAPTAGTLASEQMAVPDPQPDAPLSVLLADDSRDNRLLIHAFLKDTGYHVDDAENGAIAVAKLKSGTYDLVLMDMQMPVMDGLEATRNIRDWEKTCGISRTPIIALTASALDDEVRHSLEAGVDRHLTKPIKKVVLLAAIRESARSRIAPAEAKQPTDAAA